MKIVIIGLSLSSSWGNGHATTYRSLNKGLKQRGHEVHFFERNEDWYRSNRDLPASEELHFYDSADELLGQWRSAFAEADLIIIGSFVRESDRLTEACRGLASPLLAFYDIDTPVTIAALRHDRCSYLSLEQIPAYDLYLSFSGGSVLDELRAMGARRPLPLYCSVDPDVHAPAAVPTELDLGYLGTYSEDRQPGLERMLLEPAACWREGRFSVAGPKYPDVDSWPRNVRHVAHLPPREHAGFYCSQRFTLNLTRADMRAMGHSPSVRLFEAASCGIPIISDRWAGLEEFFRDGDEILTADSGYEVLEYVRDMSDDDRAGISAAARARVLESHTGLQRARELERYVSEVN